MAQYKQLFILDVRDHEGILPLEGKREAVMGSTLFEIMLVPGIVAAVFILPTVWWLVSYGFALRKILRLRAGGYVKPLAIYTVPFPHVGTYDPDEKMHVTHPYRTRGLSMWVDEDGTFTYTPVFGVSKEIYR